MGMRIFWILVFIAACVGGYYIWQHYYSPQSQMADGEVHWVTGKPSPSEKAAFDKENSGDTADGNSEHKSTSARQDAADIANPTAAPVTASNPVPASAATNQPAAAAPAASYQAPAAATPANLPMSDTQPPNNPNGMRIGGNGTYQWYRQGNLTYRVDTTSGSSCIAYATMEEWRKQIVYSHGCGRGA